MEHTADKVYRNAKIYSVALDGREIRGEALAIKDGKFAYAGDEAGVAEWIGDNTEVVDCNGKSIIPGLADAHMHLGNAGKKFGSCSFSDIVPDHGKDTQEVILKRMLDKLKAYAEEHRDAPIIRGMGWDRSWFSGGLQGIKRPLTRQDIDAVVPEECISLREALQSHTINAAYQAHLEDVTGSIETGKSAELVVLDSDIENTPVDQIQDIKVLETVFMGKTVYKR